MIVCSCSGITDAEIEAAVGWMRAADPDTIITPGKIYHALGKRPDCGSCMPLFLATMRDHASFPVAADEVPAVLRGLRLPGRERLRRRSA